MEAEPGHAPCQQVDGKPRTRPGDAKNRIATDYWKADPKTHYHAGWNGEYRDEVSLEIYRERIIGVQYRGALRIACFYRTVSVPAALVIAGVILIDVLASQRKSIYSRTREVGKPSAKTGASKNTMTIWQQRWGSELRGRWTARLIPRLSAWVDRQHGEVDCYLTQFLTGHGLFRAYLHKIGKVSIPSCVYCGAANDEYYRGNAGE